MQIEKRQSRIKPLGYGESLENRTQFEKLHQLSLEPLSSIIKEDLSDIRLPERSKEMSLAKFKDRNNLVLFTGGKDSLLTCKILEFHKIPYKTVFVKEKGKIFKRIKADIRLRSNLCEKYSSPIHTSKNIPLLYAYYLQILQKFPGAVLWTGGEFRTLHHALSVNSVDQTDYCFAEINNDKDIDGEVYSVINCLREFDTFRIMTNYFGYKMEYSYTDRPERIDGLLIYNSLNDLLQEYQDTAEIDFGLEMELSKYLNYRYVIEKPLVYDFSTDVIQFLGGLNE